MVNHAKMMQILELLLLINKLLHRHRPGNKIPRCFDDQSSVASPALFQCECGFRRRTTLELGPDSYSIECRGQTTHLPEKDHK